MTAMMKVKVRWSGFVGSPGYSNFYFRDFTAGAPPTQTEAQAATDRVQTFLTAIKPQLPAAVTLTLQADVEVLEDTNGQMIDILNVTPPAASTGTAATSNFAASVGAVINWRTGGVRNGRRVRGRTFLVPLALSSFEATGVLKTTTQSAIQTAAQALANNTGTPDLGVWTRPSVKGASDGAWYVANTATVPTMAAVLRSRRD